MAGENANKDALKDDVERLFACEREFMQAKDERADFRKDLKTELKSKFEANGYDFKDVEALTKIKLDEIEAREKAAQTARDIEAYDVLYGAPTEDDPLG